ncbi:hypothetical protein [Maioricimonas sp. JC845]|uniref:hypothetical protein n=1 Tax=Maioricimonas sp. JC845 TaxID=3232138 RepID=UPI00345A0A35
MLTRMNDDAPSLLRLRRLCRATALFALLLLGVTWRLWTPQSVFPQIPLLPFACALPGGVDWGALVLLGAGLLGGAIFTPGQRLNRTGWLTASAALGVLFLGDQHRLQPWAYQFALMGLIIAFADRPRWSVVMLQLLFASIYVYSALSKLDAAFFHSHGQLLLGGLAGAVGLDANLWPEQVRTVIAGAFPVGELVIAVGLLRPRLRKSAVVAAIVMHLILLLTLGPLGLDHEWGVLLWNGYFLTAVPLLFWPMRAEGPEATAEESGRRARGTSIAAMVTAAAILLPLMPWYDHWLSWSLYSSRPAVVTVQVREDVAERLPAVVQPYIGPTEPLTEWRPVSLDAWSFGELGCPVYPQLRFRLAIAGALAEAGGLEGDTMRVGVRLPPDRESGARRSIRYSLSGLQERLREFQVNTAPRATWREGAAE